MCRHKRPLVKTFHLLVTYVYQNQRDLITLDHEPHKCNCQITLKILDKRLQF